MRNLGGDRSIPLVAVVGPTASGKTALGVELAKRYNGEIVSADSMQIYKYMDIATAKPTKVEMQGVVHHLISLVEPDKPFSVADYVRLARKEILNIYQRGKLPIVVGGTGLYVSSLLNNIEFSHMATTDEWLRARLLEIAENEGVDELLRMLSSFDADSAERLTKQRNIKRIIRAIEIYKITGVTMTEALRSSRLVSSPYRDVRIGLKTQNRQLLYDRINSRVDLMLEKGLIEETKKIMGMNLSKTAKMAIGYKELIPYIEGHITLEEAVEKLKMETRRYAKRQLTWFRRDEKISWFDIDLLSMEDIITSVSQLVEGCVI